MSDPQTLSPTEPPPQTSGAMYGAEYYQHGCGPIPYERNAHWLNFFGGIADEIIRCLRPMRVLDAGCALGFLVESFWDRGVEAHGIDVSQYAISNVRRDMRAYCSVASLTAPIQGSYDLVTCIEVLEHMPEDQARQGICRMTRATDSILFSSTPDDFTEPTHVNVNPVIYWLRLFAEFQFYPDLVFDASFIAPHAFLVRRSQASMPEDVLRLFSETLRNRIYRAAFLARHSRIEHLETEVVTLKRQLEDSSLELKGLFDNNNEMRGAIDTLSKERELWAPGQVELLALREKLDTEGRRSARGQEQLLQARNSVRLLNEAMDQLTALRERDLLRLKAQTEASDSERESSAQAIGELQHRLEDSKLQATRAELILEERRAQNRELSHSLDLLSRDREELQAELEYIHSSPGWRLIERYRDWLRAGSRQHSWLRKGLEGVALWSLRRMNLAGKAAPAMVSVPARTPEVSHAAPLPQAAHAPEVSHAAAVPQPAVVLDPGHFVPSPAQDSNDYETWIQENEPDSIQLEIQRSMSACFTYQPKISVLVPVYKVPIIVLRDTIESVLAQTYGNWELCITVPGADNPEARVYLEEAAARNPRIRLKILAANEGISGNSNQALTLATGEFLALLDHDDTLAPFALFEIAQLLNQDSTINFIYSDKDLITEDGQRRLRPLFKPQWSPELMLNANYVTHLCVMRTEQVRQIGGWREETDGAQDWDLFLRIMYRFGNVQHIPKVLYHWRQISTSVASGGFGVKPYAQQGQIRAVSTHCETLGLNPGIVRQTPGGLHLDWPIQIGKRASIIYLSATPNSETLVQAAELAEQTNYPDFEILVPMAGEASSTDRVRRLTAPVNANLRDRIDLAVRAASGQTLVFIDECVTPAGPDWLGEITGPLQLEEIGIVGARLVDADHHVLRHCGIVFSKEGRLEYIYAGQPEHVYEQFGGAGWYRNWSAVSGACFAIRRDVWDAVGGMSGELLHSRLDVHLNLKFQLQTDWRIFYNPYAHLLQSRESALESSSWGEHGPAIDYVRAFFPEGDPYFNPNLECRNGNVIYKLRKRDGNLPDISGYSAQSRALVNIYDFTPGQLEHSIRITSKPASQRLDSITWFLPDFVNPFYGGIHTILRFADEFQRRHGVRSHFCIIGHAAEGRIRRQVAAAFPELAAGSRFFVIDHHARVNELPGTDAAVCSLWTTAYALLEFDKTGRKFSFIQDDEVLFYPAGSTSALVEATMGFGFLGICNTLPLLDLYMSRGGQGEYFSPCIDPTVFHDRQRKPLEGPAPYTLFCYGRPNHPRNCFELLTATLRILKQRMGEQILIVTAGDDWDLRDHQLDGVVHNLGLLKYRATGALYRMCDAGLVLMMTRHPSYLPMELMGCGSLVITNRNRDTEWLLKDGENCLLADPSPTSLAERIEAGLKDVALRRRVITNAGNLVGSSYNNWEEPTEKIYQYMLSQC